MYCGTKQGLANIDIAQSGQDPLVKKNILYRGLAPGKGIGQQLSTEPVAKGFGAKIFQKPAFSGIFKNIHETKPARIRIYEKGSRGVRRGQFENHVIMFFKSGGAGGGKKPVISRHAQVGKQGLAI